MATRAERRSNLPPDKQEAMAKIDAEAKRVRLEKRAIMKGTSLKSETELAERRTAKRAKRKAARAQRIAKRAQSAKRPKQMQHTPAKVDKETFYRSWEWTTLRMEVLKQYGRQCMCCGALPGNGVVIHVDHIKPLHTHWQLRLERNNLQVLCDTCNKGKGAWDQTDYRPSGSKPFLDLDREYRDIMGYAD